MTTTTSRLGGSSWPTVVSRSTRPSPTEPAGWFVASGSRWLVLSSEVTGEPQEGFTVAILGDTSYCTAAVELARDTDILVHEATFDIETGNLAKEYGHSTIGDAARVAKEAEAKTLIANHISARFMASDVAQLQKQGAAIFPALHIAEDFSRFEWKNGEVIRD